MSRPDGAARSWSDRDRLECTVLGIRLASDGIVPRRFDLIAKAKRATQ
jgi:hypothetical protein